MQKSKAKKEIRQIIDDDKNRIILDFVKTSVLKSNAEALDFCVKNEFQRCSRINSQLIVEHTKFLLAEIFQVVEDMCDFRSENYLIDFISKDDSNYIFRIKVNELSSVFEVEGV